MKATIIPSNRQVPEWSQKYCAITDKSIKPFGSTAVGVLAPFHAFNETLIAVVKRKLPIEQLN